MQPPQVTVTRAEERDVKLWHEYTGRLDAMKTVEIRSRVSGYLEAVEFKDGATVKKGDLLCRIDQRTFENQLQSATAELAKAKATRDQAKAEFDRATKLIASKAIAQEEYDKRASTLAQTESAVEAAEASIAEAKLYIDFSEIRSPIDGIASRLLISVGNVVSADTTPLTTIISADPVYAYFQVDEGRMLAYHKRLSANGVDRNEDVAGIPVALSLMDEKGFPHQGVIDFVDTRVNPATGTITARGTFPNPNGKLKPGLFSRIRVASGEGGKHVVIPPRAVTNNQDRKVVYVVGEDKVVQYREVELGPIENGEQVVFKGLAAGETIVVDGLLYARPGAPVNPKPLAPAGAEEASIAKPAKP